MTARPSSEARRSGRCHAPSQGAGQRAFDIHAYVKASRLAQHLPETVDDPAVLERLIALLRVAQLAACQDASELAQE